MYVTYWVHGLGEHAFGLVACRLPKYLGAMDEMCAGSDKMDEPGVLRTLFRVCAGAWRLELGRRCP